MRWETDCGNPNTRQIETHITKKSAETRLLKHLDTMREFGRTHAHDTELAANAAIEQVKGTALDHLPLNEWRAWSVKDDYSGVTVVVRVRRTE